MKKRTITHRLGCILALIAMVSLVSPSFIAIEGKGDSVDYIVNTVSIEGSSTGDKAIFDLVGSFYVTEGKVIFMKIIGPPANLGIISLEVDNETIQIFFTSEFYYFEKNLTKGDHEIHLEFETKLGGSIQKNLDYIIFGPALKYHVTFEIPKLNDTLVTPIDPDGATVNELNDKIVLNWDYYGIEEQRINLIWNEQKRFTTIDLETEVLTVVKSTVAENTISRFILLNFHSSRFSNITIHYPFLGEGKDVEPLLTHMPSYDPLYLEIEDSVWDPTARILYLYFTNKPYGERLIILTHTVMDENVTVRPITIPEADNTQDFVAYHTLPGMEADIITIENLTRTSQANVDHILATKAGLKGDFKVYNAIDDYVLDLKLTKIFSQSVSIFERIWVSKDTIEIEATIDVEALYHPIDLLLLVVTEGVVVTDVIGVDDWHVEDGTLHLIFKDGLIGSRRIVISAEVPRENRTLMSFTPLNINITTIYTVIGGDDSVHLEVTPINATLIEYDSLPLKYHALVRSPKAVYVYYSEEIPAFEINISAYASQNMQSTIIEYAQYTLIVTRDGKLFAKVVFLVKNKDQQALEIIMPNDSEVWYVLVGGSPTEILFEDDILMIPLIRSTLTGRNIAYPVEIIYVVPIQNKEMRYYLPTTSVPIILTEVNIGIPSSFEVAHSQESNPNFEFIGEFEWRNLIITMPDGTGGGGNYDEYSEKLEGTITEISNMGKSKEKASVNILDLDDDINASYLVISSNDGSGYDAIESHKYSSKDFMTDEDALGCTIELDPGQYKFDYEGTSRTMTVLPGSDNQLIIEDGENYYLAPPPLIIDLPESGKILRFRKIYTTPDEDINLTVSAKASKAEFKPLPEVIAENSQLILVIGVAGVIVACGVYVRKRRRDRHYTEWEDENVDDVKKSSSENEKSEDLKDPEEMENREENDDEDLQKLKE